jgi:hypothetical protein
MENVAARLSAVLQDYVVLTHRLLDAAVNTSRSESPESVMRQLLLKDAEMKQALHELEVHQQMQRRIYALEELCHAKEQSIDELAAQLRSAEVILERVVLDAREKLSAMKQARECSVTVDELIAYAQKVSVSSAPANRGASVSARFLPPAPTGDLMRASLLYAEFPQDAQQVDALPETQPSQPSQSQSMVQVTESLHSLLSQPLKDSESDSDDSLALF